LWDNRPTWAGRDFSREEVRRYEDFVGHDPDAALADASIPLAECSLTVECASALARRARREASR